MVVALIGMVAAAPPARACSCGGTPEDEIGPRLASAGAAFVGRVERVAGEVVTLRVERAIKAPASATVDLERSTGDPDCATLPSVGQRVAILVGRRDGGWRFGACASADPDEVLTAASLARTGGTAVLAVEAAAGAALLGAGMALVIGARKRVGPAHRAGS